MDKSRTIKMALGFLIVFLVLLILIFPSSGKGKMQGTTIGKVHEVVQGSLEKSVTSTTGSAIKIQESSSIPVYALILLIIALSIFLLLFKKKY